ncbi:hypothetical protein KC622_02135 [Candidatus Dojkabacteria bacterium]|uniref:Uncharacterized protein n=1 Tax=Candidatus Dojkabacteria bacterium TaxID=2099670 RepID=A0A955KVH1_9BACT|nr:hypothetical protein [Candidatus Dojkabacteria bacterium]MCB9790833.1 hypothetical protein [Candidatus Nomurabacteria bacterium]
MKKSLNTELQKSSKILVCASPSTVDDVSGVILVAKILKALKKDADIILEDSSLDKHLKELFKTHGVKYSSEIKPSSYVVAIDYGKAGIDRIAYDSDENTGKLKFFITPSSGKFDFDNIEYSVQGNNYDLIVLLGLRSLKDLKSLYDKNLETFKKRTLAIGHKQLGDVFIMLEKNENLLAGTYRIFGADSIKAVNQIYSNLALSQIDLKEGVWDEAALNGLLSLALSGVDIQDVINQRFFSKDYANFDLQIKLMHKVKVDKKSRVSWAAVSNQEIQFSRIKEGNVDTSGRITFNISKDFDLCFAAYEVGKDVMKVIVESNNPAKFDAGEIAKVFNGDGNKHRAEFRIEDMPFKDFEERFFLVLQDMYGLEITGKSTNFKSSDA